jgi:hypothetical protein
MWHVPLLFISYLEHPGRLRSPRSTVVVPTCLASLHHAPRSCSKRGTWLPRSGPTGTVLGMTTCTWRNTPGCQDCTLGLTDLKGFGLSLYAVPLSRVLPRISRVQR